MFVVNLVRILMLIIERRTKFLFAGLLLFAGVIIASVIMFASASHGYSRSDTIACLITTGQNATTYSAGYTDAGFSLIREGMTTNEVLRIVGEPLGRSTWSSWPEGDWTYSQPATTSGHYHLRALRFSSNAVVSGVFKLFYFD